MQRNESDSIFVEYRNAYICKSCRHVVLIVYIHDGTTPFLIECESCGGEAQSFMHVLPPVLSLPQGFEALEPTKEWYSPAGDIEAMAKLTPAKQEHVNKGGVLLRDRTDAKPIKRKIG